jgi:hypothetical protein
MNEQVSKELTLTDLLRTLRQGFIYLKSKSIIICVAGCVGMLFGYLYAASVTPRYTAVSTFVLEESGSSGGLGQYAGLASVIGVDLGGSSNNGIFEGDNIIELYRSRTMLQKTLLSKYPYNGKNVLLIDRYIEINRLRDKWKDKPALNRLTFTQAHEGSLSRLQDSVLGDIVTNINKNNLSVVKPDKKLNIIKVELVSNNEWFSKAFNDRIVTNVNDFYVQTKTRKSLYNLSILQHQTDSIRNVLNYALSGMASSIDANPNANPARQILRVPSQKKQIDVEANKAILAELVKNLELSKISLRKETPLIQLIDVPILPLLVTKPSIVLIILVTGFLFCCITSLFLIAKRSFKLAS